MILIDEIEIKGTIIKFYDGIDIDTVLSHPKDGSHGIIYCFFDSWKDELKKYNRDLKITSILENIKNHSIKSSLEIDNDYTIMYQTNGYTEEVYKAVKNQLTSIDNEIWNSEPSGLKLDKYILPVTVYGAAEPIIR
jgi:hypothetical protein